MHFFRRPFCLTSVRIASNQPSSKIRAIGALLSASFSQSNRMKTSSKPVTSEEDPSKYRKGGFHPVCLGDVLNGRYQILSKLGFGVYSTVWLAKDFSLQKPNHVAVKILTADSYGGENQVYELDILRHINQTNTSHPGYKHVIHLCDSFIHRGPNGEHLCLVTEVMGQSVMKLQRSFANRQLPVHISRQLTRQVLLALDWLHSSCGVIHTDLKPDNILVEIPDVNQTVSNHLDSLKRQNQTTSGPQLTSQPLIGLPRSSDPEFSFKIIDFGVASWNDKHLTEWIQPSSLRAPEVFLGAPWDNRVDLWNWACIIYELVQGRVMFRGRHGPNGSWTAEEDQIAQMMELLGPLPASLRHAGGRKSEYFDENGDLRNIKQLYPCSLHDLLAQTQNSSMSAEDYTLFESFLEGMLQYEPDNRKTPAQLLEDPWLLPHNG